MTPGSNRRASLGIAAIAVASMQLAACASGGLGQKMTYSPPGITQGYTLDKYTGYTPAGDIRNEPGASDLTYTEGHMMHATDAHCVDLWNTRVRPMLKVHVKNGVTFALISGITTAVGSVLGPYQGNVMKHALLKMGVYGGIVGAGAGEETTEVEVDQVANVFRSYCVLMWVQKNTEDPDDGRLKNIIAIPLPIGSARFPNTAGEPTDDEKTWQPTSAGSSHPTPHTPPPPPISH